MSFANQKKKATRVWKAIFFNQTVRVYQYWWAVVYLSEIPILPRPPPKKKGTPNLICQPCDKHESKSVSGEEMWSQVEYPSKQKFERFGVYSYRAVLVRTSDSSAARRIFYELKQSEQKE